MAQSMMLHSDVLRVDTAHMGHDFILRDGRGNNWKEGTGRNSWVEDPARL